MCQPGKHVLYQHMHVRYAAAFDSDLPQPFAAAVDMIRAPNMAATALPEAHPISSAHVLAPHRTIHAMIVFARGHMWQHGLAL